MSEELRCLDSNIAFVRITLRTARVHSVPCVRLWSWSPLQNVFLAPMKISDAEHRP